MLDDELLHVALDPLQSPPHPEGSNAKGTLPNGRSCGGALLLRKPSEIRCLSKAKPAASAKAALNLSRAEGSRTRCGARGGRRRRLGVAGRRQPAQYIHTRVFMYVYMCNPHLGLINAPTPYFVFPSKRPFSLFIYYQTYQTYTKFWPRLY